MNDGYRQAGSRGKRVERLKGRLRPYEVLGIKDEWVGAAHRQDAKNRHEVQRTKDCKHTLRSCVTFCGYV